MKKIACLTIVVAGLMISCQQKTDKTISSDPELPAMAGRESGEWIELFNGNDLTGWRSYLKDQAIGWTVEDGTLKALGLGGRKSTDLMTEATFEDFELELEWKITGGGNSGIIYMVKEDPQYNKTHVTGPEYQLIDDEGYPNQLKPTQLTGSNYDMHEPMLRASKPAGTWNTTRIIKDGPHVEHWLNGRKVVDYELWSEDWKARVEGSKWKPHSAYYGMAREGHIALQDHNHVIWFRNIRIRTF